MRLAGRSDSSGWNLAGARVQASMAAGPDARRFSSTLSAFFLLAASLTLMP